MIDVGRERMYPAPRATTRANQPAIIMAGSGETITYAELEARSNRLAHLFRAVGSASGSTTMPCSWRTTSAFVECCAAGDRSGLYYTCVNRYLTPSELAYIVNNSQSQVLITSRRQARVALGGACRMPERQTRV